MGSAAERLHQRAQAHADHMTQTTAQIAAEYEVERRYQERANAVPLHVKYVDGATLSRPDAVVLSYDDKRTSRQDGGAAWRALKTYAEVATGQTLDVPPRPSVEHTALPPAPPTRQEQIERDRQSNIAFYLWAKDRFSKDPTDLEFDPWNEILAARALLRLVGWFPNGRTLLCGLYPDDQHDEVPTVDAVRRFLARHDLWGEGQTLTSEPLVTWLVAEDGQDNLDVAAAVRRRDQTWSNRPSEKPDLPPPVPHFVPLGLAREEQAFLAALYAEVPGSFVAIYRLLAAYKSKVRESWETHGKPADAGELSGLDTPERYVTWDNIVAHLGLVLPDDLAMTEEPCDLRLERAIVRVLAGEKAKTVVHEEHIDEVRLKAAMERRGLPYPKRGRPKKAA